MADGVNVTPGTGKTIATDEVVDATLGTVQVQYVKIMDGTLDGTTKAAVGASGLAVDVKAIVPGVAATNLGKAEDAAHSSGDTGVMALAVRKDTAAGLGADGDYVPLIVDANGQLWVRLASNTGVDVGDVDVTSVIPGVAATSLGKAEDAVAGSGDTGVMALAVRADTAAATAAAGDYHPLLVDAAGRLYVAAGATENLIGLVGTSDLAVAVTPAVDTSAYAGGDTLFDKTEIAGAARVSGGMTILQSLTVVDKADQTAAAMTVVFLKASCTFGTANSAPSISDADAAAYFAGAVVIAATDWIDLGGVKVATKAGIGLAMAPAATSLYFAAFTAGTPTYGAAGDLVFNFKFLRS